MIRRLRKRFIRIATLAVTAVLLVLCLSVNIANYISVDSGLTNVLNVISDNQGTMPPMPPMPHGQPPEGRPDGQLTKETPFSTRYFVLRYDGDGDLIKADLNKIAAVTEDDVGE